MDIEIWLIFIFIEKTMNLLLREVCLDHRCGILDQIDLKNKIKYVWMDPLNVLVAKIEMNVDLDQEREEKTVDM